MVISTVAPQRSAHLALGLLLLAVAGVATADTIFVDRASVDTPLGPRIASLLFSETNGQVSQLATGFLEHNHVTLSKDGRFVVFSSPNPVTSVGRVPSSNIYSFDRLNGTTRTLVENTTVGNTLQTVPVTAALSPNNQLLAYGVGLTSGAGTAQPRRGVFLNIARSSDGVIVAELGNRAGASDDLAAGFRGLDWDPAGNSFVTISYVSVLSETGQQFVQLPAVVRYTLQNNGTWTPTTLTTPAYFDLVNPNVFPPQVGARTYLYPAVSPSGTGIAFYSLFWPDVITGAQPIQALLIIANSDGSNARILRTLPVGKYPRGLSWSRDGTQLIASFGDQALTPNGFFPNDRSRDTPPFRPDVYPDTVVVRAFDTQTGDLSFLPGIDSGSHAVGSLALNPASFSDSDGDGVTDDRDNCLNAANANQLDTDGDGLGDVCDGDDDNDGLSDAREDSLGTNPMTSDTDGDGLSDFDEVEVHRTDPTLADTDGDGFSDSDELRDGTSAVDAGDSPGSDGLPVWLLLEAIR
ncbi:MAG: hypothetical protein AAGI72_07825 [Pseudomonadota bacterium]